MVYVYAVLGLLILLLAGDALVKGAVNLSLRVGIPALIVSLTIVAFGTSAPELLISIKAALDDAPGIALGNVGTAYGLSPWLALAGGATILVLFVRLVGRPVEFRPTNDPGGGSAAEALPTDPA